MTCILKEDIQKAKATLKAQGYALSQLHKAYPSTEARVAFLAEQFGNEDGAKFFNNKYEKYLLNKQKDAMRDWVRKSAKKGIDTSTKKTLMDKIDGLTSVLKKADKGTFLNGLVEQALGFGITEQEAKEILDRNNNVRASKKKVLQLMPDYLSYTHEQVDEAMQDKEKAEAITKLAIDLACMKEIYDEAKVAADRQARIKNATLKATIKGKEYSFGEALLRITGEIKSLKATLDVSFGRQLSSMLFARGKETYDAWREGMKTWGKIVRPQSEQDLKNKIRIMEGMLMARPNSLNGNYARLGVAVGMREEAFPESIAGGAVEKAIKLNLFTASEKSFNIAIQTARANLADYFIANSDMKTLLDQKAGEFINEVTGRGKLRINNPNTERVINNLFFAPRWLMSRIAQIYNLKYGLKWGIQAISGKETGIIDKYRAKSAMAQVALYSLAIPVFKGILRAMDDEDEHGDDWWERFWSALDPRSSDFGKIVWGDTRFDPSFGVNSLIVLAARIATGESISISGVKRKKKWGEVISAFVEGKMSPAARLTVDTYKYFTEDEPKDFMYQPITGGGLVKEAIPPISVENLIELFTVDTENKFAQFVGVVADIFGIGANTYGISGKDVGKSDELKKAERILAYQENRNPTSLKPSSQSSIMKKLSGAKQERAVADYESRLNRELTNLVKSSAYKRMSTAEQAEAMKKVRDKVNKEIKNKYGLKK